MCGVAGMIGRLHEPNRAAVQRMNDAIAHRGPDAEGFWASPPDDRGWGAMLAFRRLAILDLSPSGEQPMVDPVTGHVIVYNGEIYNYLELRNRLVAAGQTFLSSGDTAVMLRALGLHGRQAVGWLRGMFAFALWDTKERKLLLARDPLGIKPLYFVRNPDPRGEWSLVFASEVRAILASGLLGARRLNPAAIASIVWNGFVVSPETVIAGIEPILPGQLRVFGAVGKEEMQEYYWNVPPPGGPAPTNEHELAQVLEQSVRLHLASDVPLGVFLSGGVDSSAVANLAQKTSSAPVHTFTLAFGEEEYNEGPFARRIAEAIGTRHQELVLTEQQVINNLDTALDALDQPTFDGLNSYYMAQAVRDAGFKVALVGTGGDELFGGYASFHDLPPLQRWLRRSSWLPEGTRVAMAKVVSRAMQPTGGPVAQQTRWAKLPDMVRSGYDLLSLYQLSYALFLPDFQRQLLGNGTTDALKDGIPNEMRSRLRFETRTRAPMAAISVLEQRMFLGERLLRDTDAASMAASIEVRLPLVDRVLLECANNLPDRQRYHPLGMKSMLRRIGLRGLDPGLFSRPKAGFVLPFDRWIRASLGKVMDQTMRDPNAVKLTGLNPEAVQRLWQAFLDGAPGIYWTRVWAIFSYVRWCHRYAVFI